MSKPATSPAKSSKPAAATAETKTAASYPVDKKGLELMAEANKKLNKSGLLSMLSGSASKYEEAREILQKAAAQFKISKNWQEAG